MRANDKSLVCTLSGLALLLLMAQPPSVAADERYSLGVRGGGLFRANSGYAEHGEAFGLSGLDVGGGAAVEAAVRLLPKTWITAGWTGFGSNASKRLSQVRLLSQAALVGVRYTAVDYRWMEGSQAMAMTLDASLAGGWYRLSEVFDGLSRRDSSIGGRAGLSTSLYWRSYGLTWGYAYHAARASLTDNFDGRIRAGGHEISGGLSVRF